MAFYRGDSLELMELALGSILAQTFPSVSIHIYLVVDGPLPLAHERWLAGHSKDIHKIVRLPENRGLASALNALLEVIEDEAYLFRMDGDDICRPERFETQVQFMEAHQSIDLAGANADDIDHKGGIVRERRYPETHEDIVRLLPRLNPVLHPTYCIRTASIKRDQLRYPDRYLTEDLAFLFLAAQSGWRFHNLQAKLLGWRVDADFLRRRFDPRRGWQELKVALPGTWRLFGFSPNLAWPIMRFGLRLLPPAILSPIYRSSVRKWIANLSG